MKNAKWLLVVFPVALIGPINVVARQYEEARTQILFKLAFERADNKQMIRWLHSGANPNITLSIRHSAFNRNSESLIKGCSPLDYAISTDDSKLLQACLDAHADVNRRNAYGAPPLSTAFDDCSKDCTCVTHPDTVIFLLNHGANPAVSYNTTGPLPDAAVLVLRDADASFRLTRLLIQKGARPLQRRGNFTAYDFLARVHRILALTTKQEKERQDVMALLKTAMKKQHTQP